MTLLYYQTFGNPNQFPIICIHGLFGSHENLMGIIRTLKEDYYMIAIDCRNHGQSFHDKNMCYKTMSQDIVAILSHLNIPKCHIIGHSMGGKIAMTLATTHPEQVSSMVIIDIAPVHYPNHHGAIIEGLKAIDLNQYRTRLDVINALESYITPLPLRQFLAKNIQSKNELSWKINIAAIESNYHHISSFPKGLQCTALPSLFIGGRQSQYIQPCHYTAIRSLFTNASINFVDASHWVHAEKPKQTVDMIKAFLPPC